jgi:hypothetical protein
VSNWRLIPPKKPPRLPPKGEKWSGLLRPATLVTVGAVAVLVIGVWVGISVSRPDTPTTLEGVTAEVMTEVDVITALLGETNEPSTDSTAVVPCPGGGPGEQFTISRALVLPASFRPAAVFEQMRSDYEERGWTVNTSSFGSEGGLKSQVIGKNLVPVAVTVVPDDQWMAATITSASRCTAPDEG